MEKRGMLKSKVNHGNDFIAVEILGGRISPKHP